MKKYVVIIFLAINVTLLNGQIPLLIEGTVVNNTTTGVWIGVNIARSVPTNLSYLNNSITSVNSTGYMLQAGDESPAPENHNLDGAIITGNYFHWNSTDMTSITHGLFTGHNINVNIKYNYLDHVPMGIIRKSGNNMINTSGGVAYNIVKGGAVGIVVKGISNVNIYNNTIYQDRTTAQTWRGLIDIYVNTDNNQHSAATGTKIKNNIFYAKYETPMINFQDPFSLECLTGFESDYNVFYCETGNVKFRIGTVTYTFAQWQAMGYDLHSVVINPGFINTTEFVPGSRLNYGTNLGTSWQTGLSTTARWVPGSSPATTDQNGTWQVGAIIYPEVLNTPTPTPTPTPAPAPVPLLVGASVENATPSVLDLVYSLNLDPMVPSTTAFSVTVNSSTRSINAVSVSGSKVMLTLVSPVVYGDVVAVSYSKPVTSPLQTTAGGQAGSFSSQPVVNKVAQVPPPVVNTPVEVNSPPVVVINSPPNSFSGFVSELNASGSYDPNRDNLTYSWIVPGNVSVSSTTSSSIDFLAPVVSSTQTVEFKLNISDGKTVQSRSVKVEILPYKPELEAAEIIAIEESDYQAPYYPHNILDSDIGTMWSANGDNQWLILELKDLFSIQHVKLAFQPGQKNKSYFDIFGSEDKVAWEPILIKSASCGFSGDLQVFDFPESKTGKEFKFVKLVGRTNSVDNWNYISEFRIFGYPHKNPSDYELQAIKLYPNPAHELVNVRIEDVTMKPDFIKILSFSGKIVFHDRINPGTRDLQIPLDLENGIYIVQVGSGNLTLFSQKLVVNI